MGEDDEAVTRMGLNDRGVRLLDRWSPIGQKQITERFKWRKEKPYSAGFVYL